MSTIDTFTSRDAAGSTVTLATVQVESNVEAGATAFFRMRSFPSINDAFGVTAVTYAIGDVIDTKATLTNCAIRNGGSGSIVGMNLLLKQALPGIEPSFLLWIFNEDPTSSTFTDNAALSVNILDARKLAINSPVALINPQKLDTNLYLYSSGPITCEFQCGASSTSLYAVLEVRTATTFSVGELDIIAAIDQDR